MALVAPSLAFGVTLNVQDPRDIAGDRLSGRRTLPMVVGEGASRWLIAATIGLLPLASQALFRAASPGAPVLLAESVLAGLNLVVAVRVLRGRGPSADHTTYMLHTYWFCGVLGSSVIAMPM